MFKLPWRHNITVYSRKQNVPVYWVGRTRIPSTSRGGIQPLQFTIQQMSRQAYIPSPRSRFSKHVMRCTAVDGIARDFECDKISSRYIPGWLCVRECGRKRVSEPVPLNAIYMGMCILRNQLMHLSKTQVPHVRARARVTHAPISRAKARVSVVRNGRSHDREQQKRCCNMQSQIIV